MDSYNLSELAQPYEPEVEIVNNFRDAAADIMSTVDINPYTQRMRDLETQAQGANLSQLAMGLSGPMMGQMMDPAMMPPEMLMGGGMPQPGMPPQMGMPPAQDPMMASLDPMGGQQADTFNNPGMNSLGI